MNGEGALLLLFLEFLFGNFDLFFRFFVQFFIHRDDRLGIVVAT